MQIILLTVFTLVAFAANSLFCRMALGGELIDPLSFTTIRLVSGTLLLILISGFVGESNSVLEKKNSWDSGAALFVYAAAFSLAYISLDTGIGALILFGAVQITMIGAGIRSGERPSPIQWLGLIIALAGLVYLVLPGISAPDPLGALLMICSGIAWGIYSIRGKGTITPILSTTANFSRAASLAIISSIIAFSFFYAETVGVILAIISGTVTSAIGYILWYKALAGLTTTVASIVQLLVPALASFGGIIVLDEYLSLRLILASILILGGVGIVISKRVEIDPMSSN
jgi:drug/metabolite transporter (DMT)-like permease